MFRALYRAFGFTIASEIELPELPPAAAGSAADVEIRLGETPPALEGAQPVSPDVTARPGALLIDYNPARYLISEGCRIWVEAKPGASERDMRGYLLGSAIGAIIHQRGLLPIHANAIDVGGEGVAFAGPQGAGKSTLAEHFRRRGRRVLSDDVCVVGFGPAGEPVAWPGIPRIKLRADALAAFGRGAEGLERVFEGDDKFSLPMLPDPLAHPVTLCKVYVISRTTRGAASEIRPLAGAEAFDSISANVYRSEFIAPLGQAQKQFENIVALLRSTQVFVAERAWGFDVFGAQAEALEGHLAGPGARGADIERPPAA